MSEIAVRESTHIFDQLFAEMLTELVATEEEVALIKPWDFGNSFDGKDEDWAKWTDLSIPPPLGWQLAILTETQQMGILAPGEENSWAP